MKFDMPIFDENGNYVQPAEPGPETGGSSPAEVVVFGTMFRWWCEDPVFEMTRDVFGQFTLITPENREDPHVIHVWDTGFRISTERPPYNPVNSDLEKIPEDFKRTGQWTVTFEKNGNKYSLYDTGTSVELRLHDGPIVRRLTGIRGWWKSSQTAQQQKYRLDRSPDLDAVDYGLLTAFRIYQDQRAFRSSNIFT
jgi:hypothetical protein